MNTPLSLAALNANQDYWEARLKAAYKEAIRANEQLTKILDARRELKKILQLAEASNKLAAS